MKSVLSLGTSELICSHPKTDNASSIACFPFPYSDPCVNGISAAYGQHSYIHSQMTGRVRLPLEVTEDGPVYVNAKQFHAILRRRKLRAKLVAQSKADKCRKPYLHESRHLHALKRVRGSDGRFLNTKLLQLRKDQSPQLKSNVKNISGPSSVLLDRRDDDLADFVHLRLKNASDSGEPTGILSISSFFQFSDNLRSTESRNSHVGNAIQ